MKKIFFTFILLIFVWGWLAPDLPATDKGTVFGKGATPCKKFLKGSDKKKNQYVIWVQGYLTAYNAIAPDVSNVLAGKDFYWVMKRLEELCKKMPDEYFNEAAVHLVGHLHPQGIRTTSPKQAPKTTSP